MSSKQPKLGDKIIHTDPLSLDKREGIVTQLLSAQFAYEATNGTIRLCMFNEDWKYND